MIVTNRSAFVFALEPELKRHLHKSYSFGCFATTTCQRVHGYSGAPLFSVLYSLVQREHNNLLGNQTVPYFKNNDVSIRTLHRAPNVSRPPPPLQYRSQPERLRGFGGGAVLQKKRVRRKRPGFHFYESGVGLGSNSSHLERRS